MPTGRSVRIAGPAPATHSRRRQPVPLASCWDCPPWVDRRPSPPRPPGCAANGLPRLTLGERQELPLAIERLLSLAYPLCVAGRLRAVQASLRLGDLIAHLQQERTRGRLRTAPGHIERLADPLLDGAPAAIESRPGIPGRPTPVVPLRLQIAHRGLGRLRVTVDIQRLGLGQKRLPAFGRGLVLGVARGEDLAAPREEGVLGGAESFPQPLLDFLG